jgi:hypothetical protein
MFLITGNQHYPGLGYSFPITGSAYVSPGTTIVQASISGSFLTGAELYTHLENVQWDYASTTNPVGTVQVRINTDVINSDFTYPLNLVDCATDPNPFSAEDEAIPDKLINP